MSGYKSTRLSTDSKGTYVILVCSDALDFHYYVKVTPLFALDKYFFADYGYDTASDLPRIYIEAPAEMHIKSAPIYVQLPDSPPQLLKRVRKFNETFNVDVYHHAKIPYSLSNHNCRTYVYAFLINFAYADLPLDEASEKAFWTVAVKSGGPLGVPYGWLCICFELDCCLRTIYWSLKRSCGCGEEG